MYRKCSGNNNTIISIKKKQKTLTKEAKKNREGKKNKL
jgi:hypothetical protein